jgi:hypothetical protein
MKKIFIGLILILLNFNLDFGDSRLGLIPSFIGYYYVKNGLVEIGEYSDKFTAVLPYTKFMVVYSSIAYFMDLFGISSQLDILVSILLGVVSVTIFLLITYNIIMGVQEIEKKQEQELNSVSLLSLWKVIAVCSVLVYVLYFLPMLMVICIAVAFVANIGFLFAFSKTNRLFYEQNSTV